MAGADKYIPYEERFWSSVSKSDGCWEWTGHLVHGYGYIRKEYRRIRAHRASWEMNCGPVPRGLMVLHSCDNRRCVNPAHLRLGNHCENMADRDSRGRQAAGSRQHSAKLNDATVVEIKRLLAGGATIKSLAPIYNVSKSTIAAVSSGRLWRHVDA
jgi:hypothetical protein